MYNNTQIQLDRLFAEEDWEGAKRVLEAELSKDPEDAWLLTRLSTAYYEQRAYKRALELAEKAFELDPGSPQIRWDYAGALDMMGREREAIAIWIRLIDEGEDDLALDSGHGRDWARSLVNDCRYRIASSYADLGKQHEAERYLTEHLFRRKQGISSIYEDEQVDKLVRSLGSR